MNSIENSASESNSLGGKERKAAAKQTKNNLKQLSEHCGEFQFIEKRDGVVTRNETQVNCVSTDHKWKNPTKENDPASNTHFDTDDDSE